VGWFLGLLTPFSHSARHKGRKGERLAEYDQENTNLASPSPSSFVDTRQPQVLITPFTRAGWILRALKYGDYEIREAGGETVLIEEKPVGKLLQDMVTGVLQKQIRGLVESCSFPILLIRGHWSQVAGYLLDSRYTWQQAWNQLQSLQDMGCRIQLTTGTNHTIERIFELEEYYHKGIHHSAMRQASGDHRLTVLSLIPGIDEGKGKALLAVFPTLADVATAPIDVMVECYGIGEVLAERIWNFWRGEKL